VQPIAGTNLVKLSVALSDPTKARLAAALLLRKVVDLSWHANQQTAATARASLEKPLAEADGNLKDAEERLSKFQTSADLERLEAETESNVERRAKLDDTAIVLESERARLATLEQELARQPPESRGLTPHATAMERQAERQ